MVDFKNGLIKQQLI